MLTSRKRCQPRGDRRSAGVGLYPPTFVDDDDDDDGFDDDGDEDNEDDYDDNDDDGVSLYPPIFLYG